MAEMFAQGNRTKTWIIFSGFSLPVVVVTVVRGNFNPLGGAVKQGQGPNDLRVFIYEQLQRKQRENCHLSQREEDTLS